MSSDLVNPSEIHKEAKKIINEIIKLREKGSSESEKELHSLYSELEKLSKPIQNINLIHKSSPGLDKLYYVINQKPLFKSIKLEDARKNNWEKYDGSPSIKLSMIVRKMVADSYELSEDEIHQVFENMKNNKKNLVKLLMSNESWITKNRNNICPQCWNYLIHEITSELSHVLKQTVQVQTKQINTLFKSKKINEVFMTEILDYFMVQIKKITSLLQQLQREPKKKAMKIISTVLEEINFLSLELTQQIVSQLY